LAHASCSHWQGRKGKLYERDATTPHPKKQMNEQTIDEIVDDEESSEESEAQSALRNAWNELAAIERETKRYRDIRTNTEKDLEECRKRGVSLEDVRRDSL
jgi:kinesin family protein 18/19